MKKRIFVLLIILCFLSQFDVVRAQYQIYLPIILSSGEKMSGLALLEITDGTTTVNLLAKEKETGFHLLSWRPQIIQPKDGGVYQDSSIAPGRDLVFAVDGTANEVFNTRLNGDSQDDLIQAAQDLLRLLIKARNYSLTSWQDTPVYIKARAACETNTRYALIKNFTIQDVDNPYSQPFFTANQLAAMNNISIGIERGHWLGSAPGIGEGVSVSSIYSWEYRQLPWALTSATPLISTWVIFQTNTGRILAGDAGRILYSDDNGVNWAVASNDPSSTVYCIIQLPSGKLLAGEGGALGNSVLQSTDDGVTWAVALATAGNVTSLLRTSTGKILAAEYGQIYESIDNGVTWNVATTNLRAFSYCMMQTSSGRILASDAGMIWYSDDDGITWNSTGYDVAGILYSIIETDTGKLLAAEVDYMWQSDDDGETWKASPNTPMPGAYKLYETSDGVILAGGFGNIYYSIDDGITWATSVITGSGVLSFLEASSGDLFAGQAGNPPNGIWTKLASPTTNMGAANNLDENSFIVNKQNISNLTHIYRDDGGVFSANLFPMTLPTTLLPAVPAVNDAVYFGTETVSTLNTGPFSSLVFDLNVGAWSTTSYTILWEYYNGAAWAALTTKDGTNLGGGALSAAEVHSVHWTPPGNWAANAVNGVTGYWIRARVSALVGTLTPPVQQNRNIYSVVNGYVEIASTEVLGDIPALSQILAHNRSDLDGPGGSAPNLYENRLIVGLRSYDRGPTFQAYLNAADEQNPFGLTVSVGTNTTFGNDIKAPTGRSATYNPAGVEAMATRVLYTFGPTIARDYYGRFHAFVRAYRDGGSSTDFTVRLQVTNGSGGVTYTTDTAQLATTTRFEVLDFGMIKIPVAGSLGLSELGDTSTIAVQASSANAAVNLIIYDLILVPTDEFCIDSVDKTNSTVSEVGKSGGFDKVLNIDSITMPKFPIRSIVQRYGSNLITSIYNSIAASESILQSNARQRLWFFSLQTSTTGLAYSWVSSPEISHSIQLFKNERYLSLRGAR